MHVRLWVPSRDRHGAAIESHAWGAAYATARDAMVTLAGGVTALHGHGAWRNSMGAVVTEPVTVLETYLPAGDVAPFHALARRLAAELDQESVLLVVDGVPTFVAADSPAAAAAAAG